MLRDAIVHMNLSIYPQIALVIFLLVFAAIVLRVIFRVSASSARRAAAMPLQNDSIEPASSSSEGSDRE